ncbi:hypothetical protein AGJ59_20915 [Cronobacter sakazakii]|nr:hypothetical protein [Cronobacter sakazakii]EGT5667107.1 hypothetical protein [Cronobacter sakazakii]EGZ7002338.1 hypothetical protein [Cronobacter sakazakii]EGZ7015705.1 hypothetical protein [Cronobacter sakazakii]EGZ7020058.1 hypothetical protein [Cronobacter sakazakii]
MICQAVPAQNDVQVALADTVIYFSPVLLAEVAAPGQPRQQFQDAVSMNAAIKRDAVPLAV